MSRQGLLLQLAQVIISQLMIKLSSQVNKNEKPVKGAEIDCRVFLKALCATSRQKGFLLSHNLLGGHFALFEVS